MKNENLQWHPAFFYQSNTEKIKEIDPAELTITFVSNHYPRDVSTFKGSEKDSN